jgi:hypothetical protein
VGGMVLDGFERVEEHHRSEHAHHLLRGEKVPVFAHIDLVSAPEIPDSRVDVDMQQGYQISQQIPSVEYSIGSYIKRQVPPFYSLIIPQHVSMPWKCI